eukprot:Phypoly_transcript_02837.p1 GENE.Phypoly_transcript_02837~~Phypoly_transcript_02837.p1  ORF type:complete len:502 (+),score=92.73 Phypoly_transcript_02837:1079-2584(+)
MNEALRKISSSALRAKPILKPVYPYFLASKAVTDQALTLAVQDKYTGETATKACMASAEVIEKAIDSCVKAAPAMKALPHYKRKTILLQIADKVKERKDEFARALCIEAGKPITDANAEIGRAIDTFTIAAEEAVRIPGEYISLDVSERNAGFQGIVRRFPIGPVSLISPFNFPLNLVAHKIGPAIAAGCPFVLKPSDRTPVTAAILGDILATTELPQGAFSIVPCEVKDAETLSKDDRFKLVSFTGSPTVGWHIKASAGKKKVLLELGGNAACVVDDGNTAHVNHAVQRILFGGFYYSGQSCISVQRIYIHEKIYSEVAKQLVAGAETRNAKRGDPLEQDTFLGPMIAESEAKRVEKWVKDAASAGAKVLAGGKRDGSFFDVTILENVPETADVYCKEIFGPVVFLEKFSNFETVIAKVNNSPFGLQAGIFTSDIKKAFYAFNHIEAGGVVINDVPSVRIDSQPYGGVKDSGLGREGLRYAIEEFTEPRIMLLKDIGEKL